MAPTAPVEYRRGSILKAVSVAAGLSHSLGEVQMLHTLDLDMDAGQAHQIGLLPKAIAPTLHLESLFGQQPGKLTLSRRALRL